MAYGNVKFIDKSKQVLAEFDNKVLQALERIGLLWLKRVTPLVPVDTSRLQKSMGYQVDFANKQVIVGSEGVLYAAFVELGTRYMVAKPYLKPSILNYVREYEAEVRKALGSGWSVSVGTSSISY